MSQAPPGRQSVSETGVVPLYMSIKHPFTIQIPPSIPLKLYGLRGLGVRPWRVPHFVPRRGARLQIRCRRSPAPPRRTRSSSSRPAPLRSCAPPSKLLKNRVDTHAKKTLYLCIFLLEEIQCQLFIFFNF